MDALVLFNSDHAAFPTQVLAELVSRARTAQGIIVRVSAPAVPPPAADAKEDESDELMLTSATGDVFEGVEDLALGLGDLHVDRLIMGGVDRENALCASAMAALALSFDVVMLADAVVSDSGETIAWEDAATQAGVRFLASADVWLRM